MKKLFFYRKLSIVFFVLVCTYANTNILLAQSTKTKMLPKIVFVCPPCGCDSDEKYHDKPGSCSDCGATMYPILEGIKNDSKQQFEKKNVAILVFPGVELIDFTGPWEVMGAAGMNVYSVAKNDSIISCFPGLKITPDYTFKNCPKPDVLLIPGGNVNTEDVETVAWIKAITEKTEHTASVCTGAYYLATAGLLDNTTATTFYEAIGDFKKNFPMVNVIETARFVDNGKIITSAGLSSGIDLAFHIVSVYQGNAESKKLANLLEYNWDSKGLYARGKLADKYLSNFMRLFIPFEHELVEYDGNEMQWKINLRLKTNQEQESILKLLEFQATDLNQWKKTNANQYQFTADGKTWVCNFTVQKLPTIGSYTVQLEVKQ